MEQQQEKGTIFLKAMGTLGLFAGVVILNRFIEEWFVGHKFILNFSMFLVFFVWVVFAYYCIRYYRRLKRAARRAKI